MTIIEEIKTEHEGLLLTIRVLERITSKLESGQAIDLRHLDRILEFLQVLVDKSESLSTQEVLLG